MQYPPWAWIAFILVIAALLAIDLGVFNRKIHIMRVKEALIWCAVWFALAMGFNAWVWTTHGPEAGTEWFASYLIELGLSVDNVFVFILIFTFFKTAPEHQHRVLFWGIIGAAIMRAIFILAGVQLIMRFHWILMVFGVFLVFTGIKLAFFKKHNSVNFADNIIVRFFKKIYPVTDTQHGGHFFIRIDGRRMATPLFLVLLVIETTDVIFATDSIPAVLGITQKTFIAFTSNIFAILGLRSLYFALNGMMNMFRFLSTGLAVILVFIGIKMIVETWYGDVISIGVSLGVIAATLAVSIIASLLIPCRDPGKR